MLTDDRPRAPCETSSKHIVRASHRIRDWDTDSRIPLNSCIETSVLFYYTRQRTYPLLIHNNAAFSLRHDIAVSNFNNVPIMHYFCTIIKIMKIYNGVVRQTLNNQSKANCLIQLQACTRETNMKVVPCFWSPISPASLQGCVMTLKSIR